MANEDEEVEVCRLCGKESRNCFPIFQDEDNILEKINICLPIDISPNDKLPSNLCRLCSYRLSISYELRCTAIEVDERLRMQLHQRQSDVYTNKDKNNFSENFLNIKRKIIDEENVLHYQNDKQEIKDKMNIHNWNTIQENIDEISYEKEAVISTEDNETAVSSNLVTEIDIVEMKYEDVMEALIEQTDNSSDFVENKTANDCQRFLEHQTLEQNSSALAEHIREIHNLQSPNKLNTKEKYVCKFCGKKFNSGRLWKNHERIHTEETLSSKCHKSFRSDRSILHYIQNEHKKKEYKCDQCGKCYSSYNSRWYHVQREHKKKEYVCDQCGKCFSDKSKLCVHISTHLRVEDRKYQCDICQKKFITNSNLTVHKRIHSGVRPYKCDVCSFSFRHTDSLKRHRMAKHFKNENKHAKNTLPKNILCNREYFVCDYCGKCFSVKNYLRAHISTHLPAETRRYQ